jgi:hypothetical protein
LNKKFRDWGIEKFQNSRTDDPVKTLRTVTPAEAGVQKYFNLLDSRFCGNDRIGKREVDKDEKNITDNLSCLYPISFGLHSGGFLRHGSRGIERNPEPI